MIKCAEWIKTAKVGDQVVCIGDYSEVYNFIKNKYKIEFNFPEKDKIYTIREMRGFVEDTGVHLVEVVNPIHRFCDFTCEPYFMSKDFRPVTKTPKGMEVLNSILANPNQTIHTDLKEVRKGVCA